MTAALKTAPPASLPLPYRFGGSYVLYDRIGQGGMAEIYLARGLTQVGAARPAVVKLVLPALADDPKFSQMLVAEAKLAADLSHANVVRTYDLGREQGRLFIAMEYVEGFDLNDLLRRCSRAKIAFPAEFALFIVGETLRALDYAHRKRDAEGRPLGIVHRDVSPSNVLISFEGEVKLCDFGIARALNDPAVELDSETIEGKAAYMSPEHARGDAIDARSDVFSASVILWELLAGRRMYKVAKGEDALALARAGVVPPLPDHGLPAHQALSAIVLRGLATSPDERYATALDMARALDDYVIANKLRASPLKLGDFIAEHFGDEVIALRRTRERAAMAMEEGAAVPAAPVSAAAAGLEGEGSGPSVAPPEASVVRARTSAEPSAPRVEPALTGPASPPRYEAPSPTGPASDAGVPAVRRPSGAPERARSDGFVPRALAIFAAVAVLAAGVGYLLAHR